MKSIAFGFVTMAAALSALPAAAQPAGETPVFAEPVVELPPRYRVEFILFAHNRFDSTEEYLNVIPPGSEFAADDDPILQRNFDTDSAAALLEMIEGPIEAPEPEPEPVASDDIDTLFDADGVPIEGGEPELEAYLDPALVEGPATRYLHLDELTLLPELERLERLDAYTPLLHSGWEQNGLAEADAVPIDLAEFASANPRGTLRLHMSRYLHIAVDIAWRDEPLATGEFATQLPSNDEGSPFLPPQRTPQFGFGNDPFAFGSSAIQSAPANEYYLFEQRRILRGELNYFDHPAFGLLLKITLAPEPDAAPDAAADGPSA